MPLIEYPRLWKEVALSEVCKIVGGGTPSRSKKKYFIGNIPWVTPTDVTNIEGLFIENSAENISEEGLKNSSAKLLPAGAVLMTSRATIGNAVIALKPMATNQGFANFICNSELLSNEFLAIWLNAIKKFLISRAWGTTFKEISKSTLATIKIPLPPLLEQEKIVGLSKQVDAFVKLKNDRNTSLKKITASLFWNFFGNYFNHDGIKNEVRLGQYIKETQYGSSDSVAEYGDIPVFRMSNITLDGWIDIEKLKYFDKPEDENKPYNLKKGDLLFNRTNSKELVGKTCLLEKDYKNFSFASYLIRVRLKEGLLPEYVWALLNSEYGKKKLFNMAKQAGNMANINATELGSLALPKPDMKLQIRFANAIDEIRKIRAKTLKNISIFDLLKKTMLHHAFSGELTRNWRSNNQAELRSAAEQRDEALGISKKIITKELSIPEERPWLSRKKRHWLMDQLSDFQGFVYKALREWKGTLIPSEDLESFREQSFPIEHLEDADDKILRALNQLAGLGLIAKISLNNHEGEYVTGFRGFREEELCQVADRHYLAKG
ncbi:restriction endonuclease subunit S [Desulfobacula phenolica]|uniref:Type I restriction enzyme, S subunit n=1 Tax=Desulfobacula phenolica TaxID=90732 RepID=A0A1H2I9S5_9BACT|nr:restriction endonuclease subunit S [Desulfobacula phenolica]SDU40897.1 type I restriction enzyme, S subunit [Desulfobacula phenolica]